MLKALRHPLCRVTFIWLLLIAGSSASADEQRLFDLINERLSYMDEVAAYKWINGLPIEDLEREAVVLDRAVIAGLTRGIQTGTSKKFFSQQINAAKEIQEYWFTYWNTNTAPSRAPDLIKVVRPELIRLGNDITSELGILHDTRITDFDFLQSIEIEGLSLAGEQSLYEALSAIRFYDHQLEQILHAGILRVGTTGDYAPFSYQRDSNADLTGIDIDLARDLASALDVKIHFTKTSWPSLMHDLNAGLYDIATRPPPDSASFHLGAQSVVSRYESTFTDPTPRKT